MLDFISELGYDESPNCLKSDNEPSIQTVIEHVKQIRAAQTLQEQSSTHDSNTNGHAENAVKQTENQIRALKLSTEQNYGRCLGSRHPCMPWLIMYAAFCINRFQIGHDGKTPYQRVRGKPFDRHVCEIGEHILALTPKKTNVVHRYKIDSRWFDAMSLGFRGVITDVSLDPLTV